MSDKLDVWALIEETPAMLWRGDQDGRCVFLNKAQRDFWGVENPILDDFDWSSTLLPEDKDKVFGPFREGMALQQAFTCEARYRRADGAVRVLRTKARPYLADDGAFQGMVGVNEDVTDLRDAQGSLDKRNLQLADSLRAAGVATSRFELAARISGLAMSEHDSQLRYTWVHNLPETCLGRTPAELVGGEIGLKLEAILQDVLATGQQAATEIDFLIDGDRRWWEVQASRIETGADEPRVIASAMDVTVRRLNEEKLGILARELSHRVKNIFAVTQAIVQQSARTSEVDPLFVRSVVDRLATLARAQDALLAGAGERVSLHSLADLNLGHLSRIHVVGDETTVPGRSAPYIALALHELGTNALKYGALSCDQGRVELAWRESAHGTVSITWKEHSPAFSQPSEKKGFGTELLSRIFAAATGGQVQREYTDTGLSWSAVVPTVPELTVSHAAEAGEETATDRQAPPS